MEEQPPGTVSFEVLDALLDEAYALEGEARREFVRALPAPQRERVEKLLEVSNALTLSDIADGAESVIANKRSSQETGQSGAKLGQGSGPAGRWRLHRELGSGGMGQVFFASREAHTGTGASGRDYVQEAAIKILWSHRASEDVRNRFLRERRLLASLDHPGLARFVDGGFLADDPLLAWEVNYELGQIYESLGLVEQEAAAYQAVLAAAAEMGHESGSRNLVGVAGLGSVLARTNPVEAVGFFEERLPAAPGGDEAVDAWLDAQYAYVGALNRVREFGRADAGTVAMAEVMQQHDVDNPRRRGRLGQLLAGVARRAGDTAAEDRHWSDAVRHMRAADNPSALAVTLSNRAIFLGRSARYEESEAAFQESLAIFEEAELTEDPTFATVMRGYAGLLFRTGRADEAIAVTERVLTLLDPESQFYARFVTEVNLAQFSFATGDTSTTLMAMTRALPVARREFADDPAVARRMQRLFVRTMVFGQAYGEAAAAMGYVDGECRRETELLHALEALEHPADVPARQTLRAALDALQDKSRSEGVTPSDLEELLALYAEEAPVFFDVLDEWHVLETLAALPTGAALSPEQRRRHAALGRRRAETAALIAAHSTGILPDLAAYLGTTTEEPASCR